MQKILEKTYYNVVGHQPESLDWFNVLVAQTIAQLRADAQDDDAVLSSLTSILNGPTKPDFLDEIRVTEISLGEEFPIFSNCRVIPVDENGMPVPQDNRGKRMDGGDRLQARMDVDLSDVVTLGIETKLVLNYPKPFVAVLPVALAVSVVRFSGTLSLSFSPSSHPNPSNEPRNDGHPLNPTGHSPTTLTFTFLDDYRLDLSVHSLIGSRSRLQDVPKIAQLVEGRLHAWFDERCVEPRFQQIVLPSLWPRKRNTRGGDEAVDDSAADSAEAKSEAPAERPKSRKENATTEERVRDWAKANKREGKKARKPSELMTQEERLEQAGAELREAEEKERRRLQARSDHDRDEGLRMRTGRGAEGGRDVGLGARETGVAS